MACNLKGKGVLVTRAAHQAAGLSALIASSGGRAVAFPCLEIAPAGDSAAARERLVGQRWDLAVFISPNAVRHAVALLAGERLQARHIAAVGEATARGLRTAGMPADRVPEQRFDSEGLLALPELQRMQGQAVVIVRGEGGRPLLGDSLRARGAKVGYAEVYRRLRPATDPAPLLARWDDEVDIVTATSAEVLDNLVAMLGEAGWPRLRSTPLVVISERMAERARGLGFAQVLSATAADDAAVLRRLCDWTAAAD